MECEVYMSEHWGAGRVVADAVRPDELFVDTVKRLGVEPFKERVYATH